MKRPKTHHPDSLTQQPLPVSAVQRSARHGKTASDLAETGELPEEILAKEIPADDLHDM